MSEIAQRAQASEVRAQRLQAMLEAGTGIRMRNDQPADPQVTAAREAFAQVYPQLAQMEAVAPLLLQIVQAMQQGRVDPAVFGQLGEMAQSNSHMWAQQGRQTLDTIYTAVAKDYGVEAAALSPRQQRVIGSAFADWIEEDPQRLVRYERQDRRLSDEFLAEYRAGFVDPFRRSGDAAAMGAGARAAGLPPAPRSSGMPAAGAAPAAKLTPDQVHENAWRSFQAARGA